ncbi:MAG: KH domain-containing protein [Euryarchaeota archaeon]|nr:KH domain-containing protein [Euryarchaeota archaeon]MDE1836163.1 KH domain-containing protein [Euryarchaeota archaeon]MDE1881018.1 KH domain-containing protein [Euryarchaeota archaeon]MDE2045474.1 KH domain-containing protein [Thermoplasmata archaeon]
MGGRGGGGGGGERVLVLPGEEIAASGLKPGFGTYRSREDGKMYASLMGLLSPRPPFMRVIPLTGRYLPQRDDLVVGVIQAVGATYWLLDIRAPHFTPLHMTGTPWQMEYGECGEYLRPGETVLVRVEGTDESQRIGVSMNGPGLGKLEGGYISEVSPTKVPRVIGKSGSMIQMIQQETGARLVVGQNGRVWIEGNDQQIRRVREVLALIDEEGQRVGLTDRVKDLLDRQVGRKSPPRQERESPQWGPASSDDEVHDGSPPRPPKGDVQGPTMYTDGQEFEEESQHG